MRPAFYFLLVCTTAFLSCNNKKTNSLLSTSNLKSVFITVNSDSGYKLNSSKGAIIKIPAKSFDVPPNTQVKIEIKEAYSMQDILLAGLTTVSNGKPLRSAGMLYFRATANDKDVKFLKPVQVTIPSATYDEAMQVYKGEIKEDSTVNWVDPEPIDTSPVVKNILTGKKLFKDYCASCHRPATDFTGPMLAGARERAPNINWAYRFTRNVTSMIRTDPYARELFAKYKSVMTAFPDLQASAIKAILDYCDNEAGLTFMNKNDSQFVSEIIKNDCGYDTFYYAKRKENIEVVSATDTSTDTTSEEDIAFINQMNAFEIDSRKEKEDFLAKGYTDVIPDQRVYRFDIETSGWYNIDVLFQDAGAVKVQLLAKIPMKEATYVTTYLCIPKRKILMVADKHNKDIYLFHYTDTEGYVTLVPNDEAFIFAIASVGDRLYYGITKFNVKPQQTITVNIKESSKEQILDAFKINNFDGIKIDIDKPEMQVFKRPCGQPEPATNSLQTK